MAAYAEGHVCAPDTAGARIIPFGGKWDAKVRACPSGWCEQCRAWWHRPHDVRTGITEATGFGASWNVTGVRQF
jgi:hypothetical protein